MPCSSVYSFKLQNKGDSTYWNIEFNSFYLSLEMMNLLLEHKHMCPVRQDTLLALKMHPLVSYI